MNIRQLMDELADLDPELPVVISDWDEGCEVADVFPQGDDGHKWYDAEGGKRRSACVRLDWGGPWYLDKSR